MLFVNHKILSLTYDCLYLFSFITACNSNKNVNNQKKKTIKYIYMKTPLIPCKREKNKNPKIKIIKKTVTPKTNCRQISTNLILKSSNMNKIQIHIKNHYQLLIVLTICFTSIYANARRYLGLCLLLL